MITPDKGKPIEKLGRKANGSTAYQEMNAKTAGLPEVLHISILGGG